MNTDNPFPLHDAVATADLDQLITVLNNNVDVATKNHNDATTLHIAVKADYISSVKYLLNKKADIHAKDKHGNTPH